jgi:hypothetical protein
MIDEKETEGIISMHGKLMPKSNGGRVDPMFEGRFN